MEIFIWHKMKIITWRQPLGELWEGSKGVSGGGGGASIYMILMEGYIQPSTTHISVEGHC